jgi:hypothetical protein
MNIHEYRQAGYAVTHPRTAGKICYTPGEVEAAADNLGGGVCVIKLKFMRAAAVRQAVLKLLRTPMRPKLLRRFRNDACYPKRAPR